MYGDKDIYKTPVIKGSDPKNRKFSNIQDNLHSQWDNLQDNLHTKIMRRVLRKIASDEVDQLGDISTLGNPTIVQEIIKLHNEAK